MRSCRNVSGVYARPSIGAAPLSNRLTRTVACDAIECAVWCERACLWRGHISFDVQEYGRR
uniref:Uncharacterized protein n=1 Tax=Parascaris univalens TaxID=6257 RepID=A0A915C887_PARUN